MIRCAMAVVLLLASVVPPRAAEQRDGRQRPSGVRGTAAIGGVVRSADDRGQPVRRASVALSSGDGTLPRTTLSDERGRFLFSGLPAGTYTLLVRKPAWVPAVFGGRSPIDSRGVPIAVAEGQRAVGLEVRLQHGAVVAGTILTPGGRPAEGVLVRVLAVQSVSGRAQVWARGVETRTDDRGVYRAFGLAPGDYLVEALPGPAAGWAAPTTGGVMRQVSAAEVRWADQQLAMRPTGEAVVPPSGRAVTYVPVYFPGTAEAADAAVVTVHPGEERLDADFSLVFLPATTITGAVIGLDGLPVMGAVVIIESQAGDPGRETVRGPLGDGRAVTGRDGTFTLTGVRPGRYVMTVRATPQRGGAPSGDAAVVQAMALAGALAGMVGRIGENPATLWATESVVAGGQDVGPLTLQLHEGLTVEGVVVADQGAVPEGVSALRIALEPPSPAGRMPAAMRPAAGSVSTAPLEDGTFLIRGLVPGRYQMAVSGRPMRVQAAGSARADGWVVRSIRWRDLDLADTGVPIQADRPLTGVVVTLTRTPAVLQGIVVDGGHRPVAAFPIVVFSHDRTFWGAGSRRVIVAQPASNGRYSIVGLPPGDYYLAAVAGLEPGEVADRRFLDGLIRAAVSITITEGETTTQDLRLASGG